MKPTSQLFLHDLCYITLSKAWATIKQTNKKLTMPGVQQHAILFLTHIIVPFEKEQLRSGGVALTSWTHSFHVRD